MLKIRRVAPPALFFEEVDRPRERLLLWAHRSPEERRQRRAPIEHDIFHNSHVADMVFEDFSGACAFCERPVSSSEGISHFRPLSLAEGHSESSSDLYSWLAYEWLNLFLICRICQKHRADQFPVMDRRARFLATFDEVRAEEKPLLLDPTLENPSSHFSFLFTGECFPKRNSAKAKFTADLLALNDDRLVEERAAAIEKTIEAWKAAIEGDAEISEQSFKHPYRGAWRDVLARSLNKFGIASLGAGSDRSLVHRLRKYCLPATRMTVRGWARQYSWCAKQIGFGARS